MILHKDRNKELLLGWLASWRDADGDLIGTTNGVFDILHAGHVGGFQRMKEKVARLIIGVNSNESAKQLEKGSIRPVQDEESRAIVLDALRYPDMIVLFDEPTPCELLELIQPDIHFKGDDYDVEKMPETEVVRKHGGEVRLLPLLIGHSTTKIIQRIAYAACPTIDSCPVRHGVNPKWMRGNGVNPKWMRGNDSDVPVGEFMEIKRKG